jgi:hypothetical protein
MAGTGDWGLGKDSLSLIPNPQSLKPAMFIPTNLLNWVIPVRGQFF